MANLTRLRELGKLLNIQTVAWKKYELEEKYISNLDFLQFIFERELEIRRQNAIRRNRKNSNLPKIELDKADLLEGILYQVNNLEKCEWVEKSQNLLLVGKSSTNKTATAIHLANTALDKGYKVMYLTIDELFIILNRKDDLAKAKLTHARLTAADVIVIDDFLYLDLGRDALELLYKTLMALTSSASIVFIANREPLEWVESANDKYTMKLLISRVVATCEKVLT